MPAISAVFDFNGTLSDDEPILCEIFMRLFAEHGKPMSAQEYFDRLAGLSDPEIVRAWLGDEHPDVDAVIEERIVLYRDAVADGSTVHEHVREAAGLAGSFRLIVSSDDVVHGKPDPEGYLKAFGELGVDPGDSVVVEDTEAGIASARAAGVGCVLALQTTLDPYRLAEADELINRLDADVMRRYLL